MGTGAPAAGQEPGSDSRPAVDILYRGGSARQLRQELRTEIWLLPVSQYLGQSGGKERPSPGSPGSAHSPVHSPGPMPGAPSPPLSDSPCIPHPTPPESAGERGGRYPDPGRQEPPPAGLLPGLRPLGLQ